MKYLRLVRWCNLLIVLVTMYVVRYCLLAHFMPLQLSHFGFALLVLATACITAAGYVINDYFDVNADTMNKPEKVIIDKEISGRNAMILYWVLNIVGCLCGLLVSLGINRLGFALIFPFVAGILWFYATTFSKEPVLGNIVVAAMVALVPLIVALFETVPLIALPLEVLSTFNIHFNKILYWVFGYALFAFLLTTIREMVKDIEDVEGDRTYGRNTLPIACGIRATRIVTIIISIITLLALIGIEITSLNDVFSLIFINLLIVIPLIYVILLLLKATSVEDYSRMSFVLKIVMIAGVLYLIMLLFQ